MKKERMVLPEAFMLRMKSMLGEEYGAFAESLAQSRTYGLRLNTAKLSPEAFEAISPFPVRPIPWLKDGYFYEPAARPASWPLYQAGLYYLQDPGAMTPASRLPILPGMRVLDLCAAPGGKATAAGAALRGEGFLLANDISLPRARALLRNLELFGIPNALVTNETPGRLARRFPSFFDCILLDAPCSGEGMFRKEEALARDWSPDKSQSLASLQKELLSLAADMLRPGGCLMYSTCTYAPEEDEEVIAWGLKNHPDLTLVKMPLFEGFSPGLGQGELAHCVRIYPHRMEAEGHFMALLQKTSSNAGWPHPGQKTRPRGKGSESSKKTGREEKQARALFASFLEEAGISSIGGTPVDLDCFSLGGQRAYLLPRAFMEMEKEDQNRLTGLSFLRHGLFLGELKKNRFEPSAPLALALHAGEAREAISLSTGDPRLGSYLAGEPIALTPEETPEGKGWKLLCVEGYPLAFGKLVGRTLKNKYPAGWRQTPGRFL